MNIQYLIGKDYYDKYREVYVELRKLGHDLNLIYYNAAISEKNTNYFLQRMSKDADITIIDDANVLYKLLELSVDDTVFPQLIAIWEWIHSLMIYCFPKPIILLNDGEKYINNLISAIEILKDQPRRYLERTGNYYLTSYGWLLRKADDEPYALEIWARLQEYILPGYVFNTWLYDKKIPTAIFTIYIISDSFFTFETGSEGQLTTIYKNTFCEIAKSWDEYKNGEIPNNTLENKTVFFPYILGILHWLDKDGKLKNIPKVASHQ